VATVGATFTAPMRNSGTLHSTPARRETMIPQAYFPYWVRIDLRSGEGNFQSRPRRLPGNSDVPSALARIARRAGALG